MKKTKPNNKIPYYTLTMRFACRTKAQANELRKAIKLVFKEKVEDWCKTKLPKNWGKVKTEKDYHKGLFHD